MHLSRSRGLLSPTKIGCLISFRLLLGQSSADGMLTQHGVGFHAIIRSTTYNQLTVQVHNMCRNEQLLRIRPKKMAV